MPPKPENPDPLAREVERLLKKLPGADPSLRGTPEPSSARPVGVVSGPRRAATPQGGGISQPTTRDLWLLWGRLAVAVALGIGLGRWPYSTACGWPLLGYMAALAVALLAAGWTAVGAWQYRAAVVHVLALIAAFWGIVLAAEQILPRVGYAARSATWRCRAAVSSAAPAVPARPAPLTGR
jgi:hypothetical protein